jgi:hypothetical protein
VAVIGLHPGTVKTEMSSPFSGNVKPDKLFTADQSATYLYENVLDKIALDGTGRIYAWDGEVIPF